jgi:SAM-dependent methyltransferase
MRAEERENERYRAGAENPVEVEEQIMFSLVPHASGSARPTALDIGCGIGTMSLELQRRGYDVTGIDFSEVAVARSREKGVTALVSDVDRDGLKFADAFFDLVWAGDVIEHVFDPVQLLEEAARVLKPSGTFLFTVPNDLTLRSRFQIALTGKSPQSDVYRKFRQCKHHTVFSWELLTYMLEQARLAPRVTRSVCRVPRTGKDIVTGNPRLGSYFGRVFIVAAGRS